MEWLYYVGTGIGGIVIGAGLTLWYIGRQVDKSVRSVFGRISGWG